MESHRGQPRGGGSACRWVSCVGGSITLSLGTVTWSCDGDGRGRSAFSLNLRILCFRGEKCSRRGRKCSRLASNQTRRSTATCSAVSEPFGFLASHLCPLFVLLCLPMLPTHFSTGTSPRSDKPLLPSLSCLGTSWALTNPDPGSAPSHP